jgi:hypothetical protein
MTKAQPGEFDFLQGEWRIAHRRLVTGASAWDTFEGEATCWSILGGVGSVEELRIPARDFSGMGLRLLDLEAGVWTDFWANARNGVLTLPAQRGVFADGAGTFYADHETYQVRGVWDEITTHTCRWRQAISQDDGVTWNENWIMHWRRA